MPRQEKTMKKITPLQDQKADKAKAIKEGSPIDIAKDKKVGAVKKKGAGSSATSMRGFMGLD